LTIVPPPGRSAAWSTGGTVGSGSGGGRRCAAAARPASERYDGEAGQEDRQRDHAVRPGELSGIERGVLRAPERVEQEVERLEGERPEVGDGVRGVGGQPGPEEETKGKGEQHGDAANHRTLLSPAPAPAGERSRTSDPRRER